MGSNTVRIYVKLLVSKLLRLPPSPSTYYLVGLRQHTSEMLSRHQLDGC